MRSVFYLLLAVLVFSLSVAGQDPTKAAPDSYKLQFENEYVKVLRVRYAPRSKVPVHDHSKGPAGYVYLTDSGPIRFVHGGWDDPVLTRPPTRAGAFRLSRTRFDDETHAAENPNDKASEFLRIEITTEAPDRDSLVGRFPPFDGDRKAGLEKREFENSQLRVTRIISRPGVPLEVSAPAGEPSLIAVISETGQVLKGQTFWLAPGTSKQFPTDKVAGRATQFELLRFDFKTKPKKG
jgi:hypothetical protein